MRVADAARYCIRSKNRYCPRVRLPARAIRRYADLVLACGEAARILRWTIGNVQLHRRDFASVNAINQHGCAVRKARNYQRMAVILSKSGHCEKRSEYNQEESESVPHSDLLHIVFSKTTLGDREGRPSKERQTGPRITNGMNNKQYMGLDWSVGNPASRRSVVGANHAGLVGTEFTLSGRALRLSVAGRGINSGRRSLNGDVERVAALHVGRGCDNVINQAGHRRVGASARAARGSAAQVVQCCESNGGIRR